MRAVVSTVVTVALALSGCISATHRVPLEDQTRRVSPLPACVVQLNARGRESVGTARKLREDEIVKLIFASYDPEKHALKEPARACTGAAVFDDPTVGRGGPSEWPWTLQDGDMVYGSAADHVKVVWLPIVKKDDGTHGGPVALIRGNEKFGELFSVGAYRGKRERVKLATARMGSDIIVTAEDDECSGVKPGNECETKQAIFRSRNGMLQHITDVSVDRVDFTPGNEKQGTTTHRFRLRSETSFKDDGVHVVERISEFDGANQEVRKSELERVMSIDDVGKVTMSDPPLWDRVVPKHAHVTPPPPAEHPADAPKDKKRETKPERHRKN